MWVLESLWSDRSIANLYRNMSHRERMIFNITRNLRRIWHREKIQDPIGDLLNELSNTYGQEIKSLDELDDITLEWLWNNLINSIHDSCEIVKWVKWNTQKLLSKN